MTSDVQEQIQHRNKAFHRYKDPRCPKPTTIAVLRCYFLSTCYPESINLNQQIYRALNQQLKLHTDTTKLLSKINRFQVP